MLKVNEIFYSIQGESINMGRPCVFIRLTGCNLRCSYCDTTYAYEEGEMLALTVILERIRHYKCNFIEITGGEPLIQKNTPSLISLLIDQGYQVQIETNGSKDIGVLPKSCIKILDIKCPGSGESHCNYYDNIQQLEQSDQIKFVIGDRNDYEFAKSIVFTYPISIPQDQILFSPSYHRLMPSVLASWILKDQLNVRLHTQLHKQIWPNHLKGV
ncbi:MAG: radical SAM protein [Desulfobacterales bacterium]|nr:radical SAM protein [Desulfobacterales bacterium]